ncbi:MAG TPA: PAS domain S-box protein, partial [Gammaproteobacteria bacterium]|nr:PAS domain S-box protein [Gammaproteobacteria bacterium]
MSSSRMVAAASEPPLWFQAHADLVFFVYGLAFVATGIAILTQPRRGSRIPLAETLTPLALFALLHGVNEWLDMWQIIKGSGPFSETMGGVWLAFSFLFLFEFGRRLVNTAQDRWRLGLWLYLPAAAVLLAALLAAPAPGQGLHAGGRYALGLPGGAMAGIGFFLYLDRHHRTLYAQGVAAAFQVAGVALLLYGALGGAVPSPAGFFPADTVNTASFAAALGLPVQLLRAVCAVALASSIVPILRLFDTEHRQELASALEKAESSLNRSQRLGTRLERILDAAAEGIVGVDDDGRALFANPAAQQMLGREEGNILGQPLHQLIHHSTAAGRPQPVDSCQIHAGLHDGEPRRSSNEVFWRADGSSFPVEYDSVPVREGGRIVGAVVTFRDITERRHHETTLRRLNRTHAVLSRCNHVLVHAEDEPELLEAFCRNVVNIGGYRLVWVGYLEDDAERTVRPVTHAGYEDGYLKQVNITMTDPERSRGPVGEAIRGGRPAVSRDTDEPAFAPWRQEAERRGYRAVIGLPLKDGGEVFAAMAIYSGEADAFDEQEVELLEELAEDLAFGILSLRARAGRAKAEAMLHVQHRAIESSRNGIMISDATEGQPLVYVNAAFERITGYPASEVYGRNPAFLHGGERDQPRLNNIRNALREERPGSAVVRNYRKDGSLFWNELHIAPVADDHGEVRHWVGVLNDVTEQKRYEAQLEHQANYDDLTDLPNRNL